VDYLKVKVGDRVRRTQRGLSGEALSYLGANSMDDLRGTLFRVAALRQGGMVYLEVFEAGGILPQGHVLAVPDAYFTAPYWQRVPPLVLKLANAQELELAQAMVQEKHYMQRRVHKLARPVAHLVLREYDREPLGALLYARPQCARVYGSAHDERTDLGRWGNINDVRGGRVQLTQWQVINLSRFYLDPCLQRRESRDYVPNAASSLLADSLWRICLEYLMVYPPAYFDLPWELRQVISYCARDRFYCTVYLASAFHLIRTNAQGLQTYARPLRGLMPHEKEAIRQSSMVSEWARSHRAEREFEATMTSHPVLRRAEGPGEERAA
jgi:hypothetical protein